MRGIVERLHENRQIELAKEILEAAGYTVSKKVDEAGNMDNYVDRRPQAPDDNGEKNYFVTEFGFEGSKLLTPELVTASEADAMRKKNSKAKVHNIKQSADQHLAKKFGFVK